MAANRLMDVHEALEYLENLDESSEDDLSDDEDFISRGTLVILLPNSKGDRNIDEDSGNGNKVFPTIQTEVNI